MNLSLGTPAYIVPKVGISRQDLHVIDMQKSGSLGKVLPNQRHGEMPVHGLPLRLLGTAPIHKWDTTQGELSKALARIGQEMVILDKTRFISP